MITSRQKKTTWGELHWRMNKSKQMLDGSWYLQGKYNGQVSPIFFFLKLTTLPVLANLGLSTPWGSHAALQLHRPETAGWVSTMAEHQLHLRRFFFKIILFIYLFMAVLGLRFCARAFSSAASGDHSSSRCAGLSLSRPLLLRSTDSRRAGSVIVAHGPSCSVACGIFPDQGSNPCPLHWQAASQPLRHQGSPSFPNFYLLTLCHAGQLKFQWTIHSPAGVKNQRTEFKETITPRK